ncbi:diiron oxygenase [Thiobacter aerophilum]|uniref:Diiron oxygenase n=1 Tax=Thiobacter aerophilum TaxID=3121275 RepID=A0ABV0EHB0_9BURK
MTDRNAVLQQLNAVSETYRDPLAAVDWPRLSAQTWWLPPDCLSLAGIAAFEDLPEPMRRRLSHYEFLHWLQVGLWLERLFLARTARGLNDAVNPLDYAARLHELREEAGHSLLFLKFMEVCGLNLAGGAFRPPRRLTVLGKLAPVNSPLFRLAVVVGEEVPDKFNRRIRAQAHGIDPVVARVINLHMMDEARHVARGRLLAEEALARAGRLRRQMLGNALARLLGTFVWAVFLPAPTLYELAGLGEGRHWQELARRNGTRRALMRACLAPTLHWLARQGVAIPPPV